MPATPSKGRVSPRRTSLKSPLAASLPSSSPTVEKQGVASPSRTSRSKSSVTPMSGAKTASPSARRKNKRSRVEEEDNMEESGNESTADASKDGSAKEEVVDGVIDVDGAAIAAALKDQVEEEDEESDDEDEDLVLLKRGKAKADDDGDWLAEERKLSEQRRREESKQHKQSNMSQIEKVRMLDNLLSKASAYSAFLRARMQEGAVVKPEESHGDGSTKGKSLKGPKQAEVKDPRQPRLVTGATMRKYQVISFFAHLYGMGVKGPYLVVAPLSTVPNWHREFARFAPDIPTTLYHGSKEERKQIREEFGFERAGKQSKNLPRVFITSFEVAMNDSAKLQNVSWKYLVVDEGQRLKNKDCKLLRELKALKTGNRLLLSGTPLQNNLTELWSLLNFILPDIFQDLSTFQSWFDFDEDLHNEGGTDRILEEEGRNKTVSKLHTILDPFLLRRLKSDVELGLPPKHEYLIMAPLTATQQRFNAAVADQTLANVIGGDAAKGYTVDEMTGAWEMVMGVNSGATSLQNVLMQLRKCCNHPYLLQAPMTPTGDIVIDERLVQAGGKLQLLDRMLTSLKAGGHKVLIFCQMTRMLDLLEDYLELRGWQYDRIDGGTQWSERQPKMDEFNKKDSDSFVFLLSTRAGGIGVNLVGADTVIIYDSDFNPQQDLQAMDRCHRIGQTRPVSIFRMVTASSVETKIVERATNKRKLELVAIARKRFKVSDKLEHGTDLRALQDLGKNKTTEEKATARDALTQVRQSLTSAELAAVLHTRALSEVNKDIISDADLDKLVNKRGAEAVKTSGKGWEVIDSETGGILG